MSEHRTFVDRVLAGEVITPDDAIEDEIARWSKMMPSPAPLHDWLGMSRDEYRLWVERPEALREILAAHHYGQDVFALIRGGESTALAARGASPSELKTLRAWLEKTGRL